MTSTRSKSPRQELGRAADPHISAVCHSYDSLTTSHALQQGASTVVDEAVFYGSLGLVVAGPSQMGMDYRNVWVLEKLRTSGYNLAVIGRSGLAMINRNLPRMFGVILAAVCLNLSDEGEPGA